LGNFAPVTPSSSMRSTTGSFSRRLRPSDHIIRAVIAVARSRYDESPLRLARSLWPEDKVTPLLVTRAATVAADTTSTGWANDLAAQAIADLLVTMGGAASNLLARGLVLQFGRGASLLVPAMTASSGDITFVSQGSPIPVRQLDTSGSIVMSPKKFATIFTFTRELLESSAAEVVTRATMNESLALALDSALLGTTVGSATAPPGLRYGITATAATSGTTVDTMRLDLGNLATAVTAVAGLNFCFIAAPSEAVKIALQAGPAFEKFPVLASTALPAKTVVCVALNALCAVLDPVPRIELARDEAWQLDTSPLPLADGSSTPAPNTRSAWQTDVVGIRMIMPCDWALRASGAIAWVSSVTW
jgi:Phage capsid family